MNQYWTEAIIEKSMAKKNKLKMVRFRDILHIPFATSLELYRMTTEKAARRFGDAEHKLSPSPGLCDRQAA
jgi:hypothetical protein